MKVWALLHGQRDEVYPEDIQGLAKYVLSHRVWLGPHAAAWRSTREALRAMGLSILIELTATALAAGAWLAVVLT